MPLHTTRGAVGVLEVPPENVLLKGRLQPGRLFLVDQARWTNQRGELVRVSERTTIYH